MATILDRPARRRSTKNTIPVEQLADIVNSLGKCKDGQMVLASEEGFSDRKGAAALVQRVKKQLTDEGVSVRTHTVQDNSGQWYAALSPKSE